MGVPSNPTLNDIIVEGMKSGGQTSVTSGSAPHTAFVTNQFQTIKTEVWAACRNDALLETEVCLLAGLGNSTLTLPTDFDHETKIWTFDATTPYRGTAQTGGSSTITLAADFTEDPAALYGRYIFTLGGTGSAQHRQIIGYDNTTKIVTVASAWTVNPDSTTTYLIGVLSAELVRQDTYRSNYPSLRPRYYSWVGQNILVFPAGDQIYPLIFRYIPNLTRLDETGTVFTKHLRERRWLWIQGIKTYTAERYDQDNFPAARALWEQALSRYSGHNMVYTQMAGTR